MALIDSLDLVPRVLAGDVRAIARIITRAESGMLECRPALDLIYRHSGRAHIIGITGVPGCGKSTLVAKLVAAIRRTERRVAVVAIDPSSPFSDGAILGDRIRLSEVADDPGVYVRSMATRGAMGGLAQGALDAVDVLDAAGFEFVLIETVGAGQDEVDVARAAHTVVVVSAPGLGDDIQTIKAGILEIADIHVVSKCDRADADKSIAELKNMMSLGLAFNRGNSWRAPVIPTIAVRDEGVCELMATIDCHWKFLADTGEIVNRCALIDERRLLKAAEEMFRLQFLHRHDGRIPKLLEQLRLRSLSPHRAARCLLDGVRVGTEL